MIIRPSSITIISPFLSSITIYIAIAVVIMFKNNTTQFLAEFNHPVLDTIKCTTARSICCQGKRLMRCLRSFSISSLTEQFIAFSYLGFSSINSNNHYFLSLHACQFENSLEIQAESVPSSYLKNKRMQMMQNAWHF